MVDEHAYQLVTYRPVDNGCSNGRIDATGQSADRYPVSDSLADRRNGFIDDAVVRPVGARTTSLVKEVLEDLLAMIRVVHFRMELDPEDLPVEVLHGGDRSVRRRCRHRESCRRLSHSVVVTHPNRLSIWQPRKEKPIVRHGETRWPELRGTRGTNRPPERLCE